ncbi:MAG: ABC transporter substrate-binding protein, partial [Verrucomicrobiales bacterium]
MIRTGHYLRIGKASVLALGVLAGCGGGGGDEAIDPSESGAIRLGEAQIEEALAYRHPLAEAFYARDPDFFRIKAPADLPVDLEWEDGMDQEEFASPDAIRGGVEHAWVQDYPRTLRTVGPDASSSFRSFIHDNHSIPLVKKHPQTGRYFPGLAREWAVSADRRTVYFRLDPDARFSDGVPVRARHFFFTFYFMQSPWIQAPWYNNWYAEKYTHITAYDEHTIAVELADAKPDTLRFFEEDLYPRPEHFYQDFGEDFVQKYSWRFIPSTGPYVIYPRDIRKGRSITQTRQQHWWADDKKFWRHRFNPDQRRFTVT